MTHQYVVECTTFQRDEPGKPPHIAQTKAMTWNQVRAELAYIRQCYKTNKYDPCSETRFGPNDYGLRGKYSNLFVKIIQL